MELSKCNETVKVSVGIDVSKGHSTVSFFRTGDKSPSKPFTINHDIPDLKSLERKLDRYKANGTLRIYMECTGRYHLGLANGLYKDGYTVYEVNPKLLADFHDDSLRKPKTDPVDAQKIASYGIQYWNKDRRPFNQMDSKRECLKECERQYKLYTDECVTFTNNLLSLTDLTCPGVNRLFSSNTNQNGHLKWVDFVNTWWHVDCIRKMSMNAFSNRYCKWCQKHGYEFSEDKAEDIMDWAKKALVAMPKSTYIKKTIQIAVNAINDLLETIQNTKKHMNQLASQLPEYPVVMKMDGVGEVTGPIIMGELGDVTRFNKRSQITAFAGVDPKKHESGDDKPKSSRATKIGSPELRRALYLVMTSKLARKPQGDRVYDFIVKKRSEGKKYLVYMTAGANKFLRIYYGTVRDYMQNKQNPSFIQDKAPAGQANVSQTA